MAEAPPNRHLTAVLERNIQTLLEVRRQLERKKTRRDRIADGVTRFSGSMAFVYLHVVWFGAWIVLNLGPFGLPAFDPFPFGLLTMIVSLEAIFLSTFVLISQNRMGALGEDRADLDVQIDMLAEYEITKVLRLTDAIARHLELGEGQAPELQDLEQIVQPDVLLREMEARKEAMEAEARPGPKGRR